MSKFTERPYVETILSEVSANNKKALLNNFNGKAANGTDNISYTVRTLAEIAALSAGIYPTVYNYAGKYAWKGYVIVTTHFCCFLTFKTGFSLDSADIYDVTANSITLRDTVSSDYVRSLLREDTYIDESELPTPEAELPDAPVDASTKTYVLKLVNGVKTWVEEEVETQASEPAVEGD